MTSPRRDLPKTVPLQNDDKKTLFAMNLLRIAARNSATPPTNPLLASSLARARPSVAPSLFVRARLLSNSLRSKLDKAVKNNDLVLFMKGTPDQPLCGFSRAAVQILGVQGVDLTKHKTFNVLEDDELREGIKEYSSWPTIPQVYIKGEFIGGTDILLNMHQSGDLEELLSSKGLIEPEEEGERA
ncbi:hypothetical protein BC936DRAFT_150028 [Jimgerdemannia flammicorona]|uniref:Monothiol glutaredoxin-5, mitochondrial n=1 Tax=Jimgerdemannia flammicorona TaxID=994334 RepID=A0A433CZN7_9FUNG|nr:hypothetical protein BC936DRAFT_150028 [Jimgerdemannia flammicorona]